MKKSLLVIFTMGMSQISFSQVSGNINYQGRVRYPDNNIELRTPSNSSLSVTVKGLVNLKADTHVAIFSVTQSGKTAEDVSSLMDERINQALANLKTKQGVEVFVDMISFVPVFEYEVEKKTYSKKTYNEIPKGFELKKNIHIKFKTAELLNDIVLALSNSGIYDLVRVDYFSDKIEMIKTALADSSKILLQEKMEKYRQLLGSQIDNAEKKLAAGFRIMYPAEMYEAYQAYALSNNLILKKNSTVNLVEKSTTIYYQPVLNKEFDFVINPTVLEPVIQVMYEIILEIKLEKEIKQTPKEYFIITPNGDMKKLPLHG